MLCTLLMWCFTLAFVPSYAPLVSGEGAEDVAVLPLFEQPGTGHLYIGRRPFFPWTNLPSTGTGSQRCAGLTAADSGAGGDEDGPGEDEEVEHEGDAG